MTEILTTRQRLQAFAKLGAILHQPDEELRALIDSAARFNAWFTPISIAHAVRSISFMLNEDDLEKWLENYSLNDSHKFSSVGLILAGNIPMVGFHDILCVLITGNKALIKLSSQDNQLIPYVLRKLIEIEPAFDSKIEYIERLSGFDAVIATGSNNTSRYFDYYFSKVPHIIRRNRNSVAILTGLEDGEALKNLGHDIFDYFGLGCRNVSKLYVPKGYEFRKFFEGIESHKLVIDHHKYNNNYDYNKSIFLVNLDKHLDNGFLLLKEDKRLASPLAVLYYEEYNSIAELKDELAGKASEIQCIVSATEQQFETIRPGDSQNPRLWDYADGIDTVGFLLKL